MTILATIIRAPWPILGVLALHVALAVACLCALLFLSAPSILGVHPAVKPLKFAISVSMFLASTSWLLATIDLARPMKQGLAWAFALTLLAEIVPITIQALRGVPSHFNTATAFDAAMWRTMGSAIVVLVLALVLLAILTTTHELRCAPAIAFAYRAALWITLLAGFSGFAMGGRHSHSVQGVDGGGGLPITNWSTTHGDLRVSHFWALHALQALPALAWLVTRLPVSGRTAGVAVGAASLAWVALTVLTLVQAFAGRAFLHHLR